MAAYGPNSGFFCGQYEMNDLIKNHSACIKIDTDKKKEPIILPISPLAPQRANIKVYSI